MVTNKLSRRSRYPAKHFQAACCPLVFELQIAFKALFGLHRYQRIIIMMMIYLQGVQGTVAKYDAIVEALEAKVRKRLIGWEFIGAKWKELMTYCFSLTDTGCISVRASAMVTWMSFVESHTGI